MLNQIVIEQLKALEKKGMKTSTFRSCKVFHRLTDIFPRFLKEKVAGLNPMCK